MTIYNNSLTEQLGMDDSNTLSVAILIADIMGLDDTQSIDSVFHLVEKLGISETLDTLLTGQISLADGIGLDDAFSFFIDQAVSDQLGLSEDPTAYKSNLVLLADVMVLSGLANSRLNALNALASIVGLIETLEKGLYASILDKIGITEAVLNRLNAAGITTEQIGLLENAAFDAAIYLELNDALAIEDDILLAQKLQNLVNDGMSFAVTLVGPSGDVYTGWVMNSENMAVSTYKNYEFTDMARINGNYYGVKTDGLYLLDGTLDDGGFIESIIRSAKMEFGTSNLKAITAAYLGFRADGNPVMKIITNESEETWYNVQEYRTDLHTAHIRLGKGQIGRYWQFELVTRDSTELELDSVELVPMVFKRKI